MELTLLAVGVSSSDAARDQGDQCVGLFPSGPLYTYIMGLSSKFDVCDPGGHPGPRPPWPYKRRSRVEWKCCSGVL